MVSGILLLARALSAYDPTSLQGDGPREFIRSLKDRPTIQIASANVTSLQGVWDLITELHFDLLALQELHITDLPHWQRKASQADLQLVVPNAAPGSEHLVGFLVRKGTLCTVPFTTR